MTEPSNITSDDEPHYRETTERFWLFQFVTEVREDGVYIRVFPIHRSFRQIPRSEIESASATTYSPESYSGWHWGVRQSLGGNTVYRLRGDRGVELRLTDSTRIFVGSETPTELEAAIHRIVDQG